MTTDNDLKEMVVNKALAWFAAMRSDNLIRIARTKMDLLDAAEALYLYRT